MEAAQPEPAELVLSAMRATNDFFRACLSGSERRVGDPALSSPEQGKDATIALLLSLSNSARRENAALLERAALPLKPYDSGAASDDAPFAAAAARWEGALAAVEHHVAAAQQAKQAALNLLSRDAGGAGPAAPAGGAEAAAAPALAPPPLALAGTSLDAFPAEVRVHTQQWLAVYAEVQRLGLLCADRRALQAGQAARLDTISSSLASMRAHLLAHDGVIPAEPLGLAEEAAALRELAALAASRGRAQAIALHEAACVAVAEDGVQALAAQRARVAEAEAEQLFQAQLEEARALAAAELAGAYARVERVRARIALLELQDRVTSALRMRRARWGGWVRALRGKQQQQQQQPPPPNTLFPPRTFRLASLAALGAGGGGKARGASSSPTRPGGGGQAS